MAQKKKYEKYCNFTRRKSTYPPQGGYHDSGIMLEREEGAIGKRLPKIKKNRNLRKESGSAQTPVLCSAVCRCVTLESRGCRPILLSPPSTVPLYSTVRETPNPSSTVCETHPCSLLHRVHLCHLSIAWLPRHHPLTVLDRRGIKSLSNLVIQLREVCNHPDLLESAFDGSWLYPPVNEIVEQCENFRLLEWLLKSYLQAEADCTKAINLDKKNVKVYFRRGRAREMLGYYTDAIDESLRKLEEQPEWLRGGKLCGKLCDYHVCRFT
ncbi:hypothetical protein Ahy_B08g090826 isoform B [Arachis hypogaea]|uniref:Uncharacterized protein n=1 Tax=Arachis hypogaea TaxID=3818 RepID=A0A444Y0R1_ARAHY|nr:hypothetical protein Ahy_B08g090826 isoform A [Arachis hypogaea]RYQ95510.1 hypothetical protein Ahy_B08g090826 isoform B [Arachis hypogaea]